MRAHEDFGINNELSGIILVKYMIVIDKNPVCVFSQEHVEWQRRYEQRSEQRGLSRLGGDRSSLDV
jgi:hypothetical protein